MAAKRAARAVVIFVCNPRDAESVSRMRQEVDSHLEVHPEARLTHLQSSASWSDENGTMGDEHVLTMISEYEMSDTPPEPKKPRR